MSAAACTCFQSSEESKTRGHHSNTNPKIILQAQTTTDSAQHIMVLRLTFRQVSQIIQVFPALGSAKKIVHTHHCSKESMRKAQRGFIHCRGDHRGRSWGQPATNKTIWELESHQDKEVHEKFILFDRKGARFSTRYLRSKFSPSFEPLSMGYPPQAGYEGPSKGGEFCSSREGTIFLYWWIRKGSPHISTQVLQSCHILK